MGELSWDHKTPADTAKIILLGDSAIGKTCLCITLLGQPFPREYIPTIFDVTQLPPLEYKNKTYKIELHDTVSRGDYDEIRPKQYPGTNLILICFAVISAASYRNVKLRWIPEVEIYQPRAPILLVGLKQDLRDDRDMLQNLTAKGEIAITKQMGEDTAKEIGAVDYIEYSAITGHNQPKLLETIQKYAVKSHVGDIAPPRRRAAKGDRGCILC